MTAVRAALIVALLLLAGLFAAPIAWCGRSASMRPFQRLCRLTLLLLGVRVRTIGILAGPSARLVVANHVSWIDAVVLAAAEPFCFLAKREVAAWPLVATLARSQGTVFVDRARRRRIPAVNAEMADRLRHRRSVLLFPEGTTTDGQRLAQFRTAHLACLRSLFQADAAVMRATVQPIALTYSDPAAAWIGDDTLLPHLWRVLRRPTITCTLVMGTPIVVEPGYDRKALGRCLAAEVESLLARAPAPALDRDPAPAAALA